MKTEFDPEEQNDNQQSSDEGFSGDGSDDAEAGREHYEVVGYGFLLFQIWQTMILMYVPDTNFLTARASFANQHP